MKFAAALGLALLSAAPAWAQSPVRVRGTVAAVDGTMLSVKTASGETVAMSLAPTYSVSAVVKKTPADITDKSYIGVGARPQADGTLRAIQIYIFPEAQRGVGEGHRDWAAMPQTTMTNATVAAKVSNTDGPMITLDYKGGEKKVTIPSDAKIISTVPADKADLKVGTEVVTSATKDAAGKLVAERLVIGRDGVSPPL